MKSRLYSKKNNIKNILVAAIICLSCLSGSMAVAQSHISRRNSETASTSDRNADGSLLSKINEYQLKARNEISKLARQFKKEDRYAAIFILIFFSFAYGFLHALGPGHGKSIVMSYMLAEENASIMKGVFIGTIIAFGEAVSAALIVYTVYYFALGKIQSRFNTSEEILTTISYWFILFVGLLLLVLRLKKHIPRFSSLKRSPYSNRQNRLAKENLLLAVPLAVIPCPGVMILLLFMLSIKLPAMGLMLALSMAFGMAVTISFFGAITAFGKTRLLTAFSGNNKVMEKIEAFVEISAAVMIIILACFLLF